MVLLKKEITEEIMPTGERNDTDSSIDAQFYYNLLHNNPAVLYVTDLGKDHVCKFVSDNIYELAGFNAEEMLNKKFWSSRIHPEDKQLIYKTIQNNIGQGKGCVQYRFKTNQNGYRWILDHHRVVYKDDVPIEIIGSWIDITDEKDLAPNLEYFIHHDQLTGYVNRKVLQDRISTIEKMNFFGKEHVLCYLDLDQFKVINSTYGFEAGDALLQQLAETIKSNLGKKDLLARLDGDEFGILMEYCTIDQAQRILDIIQDAIHEFRFYWQDKRLAITASMGVVSLNKNIFVQGDFLSMAFTACSSAKEEGRNRICMYSGENQSISDRQKEMLFVENINMALEEDRFFLYYQPIVPLQEGVKDKHFELLIRMKDTEGNLVPPGLFLPPAERYNLSSKIDRWVIQTAFSWLEAYSDVMEEDYSMGINLSGQSMADSSLLEFVIDEFDRKEISPEKVYFEVTETAAIANMNNAINFIKTLKNIGCRFALDDFGSGLSSFSYLKNIPVDFLKIDGAFIRNIANNRTDFAMVRAIHEVAKEMGKITIAEFVENDEIIIKLKEIGVNYAQGYGICKPLPLSEFKL